MSARPNAAAALVLPAVAFVGSAAVAVYGAVSTATASQTLSTALTSGTGTAVDVYGSQSAIVVSSGLLTAGIVGLVVSIALFGALIAFGAFSKPAEEAQVIEVDGEVFDEAELDAPPAAEPAAAAEEPVVTEEPVVDAEKAAVAEEPAAEASGSAGPRD